MKYAGVEAMKTIDIYGENRFETYTKTREACRGIVIREGKRRF